MQCGGLAGCDVAAVALTRRKHRGIQAFEQLFELVFAAEHAQRLGQTAHQRERRESQMAGAECVPRVGVGAQLAADGQQPALLVGRETVFTRQQPGLETRADLGAASAEASDISEVSSAIDAIDTIVALEAIGATLAPEPVDTSVPEPDIPVARTRGAIRSAMPLRKPEDA